MQPFQRKKSIQSHSVPSLLPQCSYTLTQNPLMSISRDIIIKQCFVRLCHFVTCQHARKSIHVTCSTDCKVKLCYLILDTRIDTYMYCSAYLLMLDLMFYVRDCSNIFHVYAFTLFCNLCHCLLNHCK